MKNNYHVILVLGLFFAICTLYYQLAINNPIAYIWATYEDLLGEWAQFYLFLFALIFSVRHAICNRQYRVFFITLAIACFYVTMEEISWGQRVFGWGTSEFFKKNNLQGETNLHNMLTGPYSTVLKQSLEYILAIGLSGYGLLYPLAIKYKLKIACWMEDKGLPTPPLYLAPFFVSAAFLELGHLSFNEAEIAEIFVGLGLSLMALHYLHFSQAELNQQNNKKTANESIKLSYRIVNLVFLVSLLSIATTFSLYATNDGKRRADRRINNGIEKFSGRYENYKNWEMVILLNKKLLRKSPSNRWVLRNLGRAYRKMDDIELSNRYVNKAISKDLVKLSKKSGSASTNRSLVRSYRIKGDSVNSKKYLNQAFKIGLSRLKKYPDSANAKFSLGKTYIMMGQRKKARALFIEAYKLKPKNKAFRKEYYKYL